MQGKGFVAVHVGAGFHAAKNKTRYLQACKRACQEGVQLLKSQNTDQTIINAVDVVEHMIRILEDDPITNAGIGSNLNLDGMVECDASIMNGTTLGFGSVGAVSDFRNPISVASKILQEADQGPLSLGRIPPIMLVGSGASDWADTMGYTTLDRVQPKVNQRNWIDCKEMTTKDASDLMTAPIEGSLVTREALNRYLKFQKMLQDANTTIDNNETLVNSIDQSNDKVDQSRKRKAQDHKDLQDSSRMPSSPLTKTQDADDDDSLLQDTVGAICVDSLGRVAAGVSSGGIAMKFPGRVSEAAMYGAGCWAQDPVDETPGFACSMTGVGEQICKTLLARTCMEIMVYEEEENITNAAYLTLDKFIKSPLLKSYADRHAGFIAVKVYPTSDKSVEQNGKDIDVPRTAEFAYAHTTKTMVKIITYRECV
ncbi:taspase, threonine aspartase, 1 [Haplosporangium sp. Z 27]|nr:taspase, threonine aspartase, 1 [Haplosporangium sp. Z 27]